MSEKGLFSNELNTFLSVNHFVFLGVLIPRYSVFIPSEPLFQSDSIPRIELRVGSCDAGTTVPNGAGARYPARPSLLLTYPS